MHCPQCGYCSTYGRSNQGTQGTLAHKDRLINLSGCGGQGPAAHNQGVKLGQLQAGGTLQQLARLAAILRTGESEQAVCRGRPSGS